ncbi:hypothetical protein JG688_00010728, partial [Phytophthora aleatoria]
PRIGNDAPDGDTPNRESQPGIKYLTTGHGPRGDQECEMEEDIVCTTCSDVGNNVEMEDQASQKLQATQSVMKALEWRTRVGSEPRTMNPGCKYQLYKVQDKTDRPSRPTKYPRRFQEHRSTEFVPYTSTLTRWSRIMV